jgi:hypothetical protein
MIVPCFKEILRKLFGKQFVVYHSVVFMCGTSIAKCTNHLLSDPQGHVTSRHGMPVRVVMLEEMTSHWIVAQKVIADSRDFWSSDSGAIISSLSRSAMKRLRRSRER